MTATFDRRLYCLLTDGEMSYPVFAEVRRGVDLPGVDTFVKRVSETYHVAEADLRVVTYPRWAIRTEGDDGHGVHVGMVPAVDP